MDIFKFQREITPVTPDTIFSIGNFGIANTTLYLFLIFILLVIFSNIYIRKFKLIPNQGQSIVESVYEWIINLVNQITNNQERSRKIFPLVATLFLFILFSNLAGLVPGAGAITFEGKSVFRTPTADFNTTFALAVGSIVLINLISIKEWGIFSYLGKFFKVKEVYLGFKKGIGSGFMAFVEFFIGLLDIIGEFAKIISLSLRLFGNMYAGEVLMTILIGSFAYFVPSIWLAMSLLSAVVQAIVFTSLVTVFYTLAIKND